MNKTKFPDYRIEFMKDNVGNFNEIVKEKDIDYNDQDFIYLTIEEGIEFQKKNPKKIISIWNWEPQEIICYLKKNNIILI